MANNVQSRVLDLGLNVLDTETTHIYICSSQPTSYIEATSTYALGNKNFGAGAAFGSPANGTPTGSRKVSSAAITDGSVTAGGTAGYVAFTDNTNSRFHGTITLSATQVVTSGNVFTLGSFDVTLNGQ